jgi:peptidoglycan/LPS O-acetylase OafA/YrhL
VAEEKQHKLLYLESLRGIAAVVVVLAHFAEAFFPRAIRDVAAPAHNVFEPWFYGTPLGIVLAGDFAVCLFFVMSAFVLVRPFFITRRPELLTSAAYRRYARLMPPVALSVVAAYLLLRTGLFTNLTQVGATGSQWLAGLWNMPASIPAALYQALVGAFTKSVASYNPLLWTMTTEFLGSMMIFAIAALIGTSPRRWLIYGLLAALTVRSYYLGFVLGLVLADVTYSQDIEWRRWLPPARLLWCLPLVLLGLVLGAYPAGNYAAQTAYHYLALPHFTGAALMSFWHTAGAAALLVGVMRWPRAKEALSHWLLVPLGRMSFSLYLTHLIILCTLGTALFAGFHALTGYQTSALLTFALTFPVMLSVSYFYTEHVDQPAIRNAKRAGAWLIGAKTKSQPAPAPQAKTPAGEIARAPVG